MRLDIFNEIGLSESLEVFDDFKVLYNHQFEDYNSINGKKTPYTDYFKVPDTDRNRRLLGIPFDITYPKHNDVFGQIVKDDGSVLFKCVYSIDNVVINTLHSYINLHITDSISYAIARLSETNFQDILTGDGTNFKFTDSWIYNTFTNLEYPNTAPFVFPYYNFNNKDSIFAYDPMRDLNQMQPTWIVPDLIKMIFNSVGIDIQSRYLFSDDLLSGVSTKRLGLNLPVRFYNSYESKISSYGKMKPIATGDPVNYFPISEGLPSIMNSYSRIMLDDFHTQISADDGAKFNFNTYGDTTELCSMVDGKCKVTFEKKAGYTAFGLGAVSEGSGTTLFEVSSVTGTVPDLEIWLVKGNFAKEYQYNDSTFLGHVAEAQFSNDYDISNGLMVGYAKYLGVYDTGGLVSQLRFTSEFFDSVSGEMLLEANQNIELGFVLKQKAGTTFNVPIVLDDSGTAYSADLEIKENFFNIDNLSPSISTLDEAYISFEDAYPAYSIGLEFIEATEIPPRRAVDSGDRYKASISLYDSYNSLEDSFKLIDIIKLVMERFNLTMFSRPDGSIHIDTYSNRNQGNEIIDYYIDSEINVSFDTHKYGLLTVKDNNPSFYEEDYNSLDKVNIVTGNKEEYSLSFKSAIVNEKMFKDEYDDTAYELLKAHNKSDYWGTADRQQVLVKDMKPTFVLLDYDYDNKPLYFPSNISSNIFIGDDYDVSGFKEVFQLGIGFYNYFIKTSDSQSLSCKAVPMVEGYYLKSFDDNNILDKNTVYRINWERSVKQMMDNEVMTIQLNMYASPETINRLMLFPNISLYNRLFDMSGFNNFDLSADNGGIISILLKEKLPPATIKPCHDEISLSGAGYQDGEPSSGKPLTGSIISIEDESGDSVKPETGSITEIDDETDSTKPATGSITEIDDES